MAQRARHSANGGRGAKDAFARRTVFPFMLIGICVRDIPKSVAPRFRPRRASDRIMTTQAFALFDTAIGRCAIAWGGHGIIGVQLPEAREAATRARMKRRFPGASEQSTPPHVGHAIAAIVALLRGEARDLTGLTLDMEGVPEFNRRVYEVARQIPPGRTLTYGAIAARLGDPGLARAVGHALGRNPFPIVVPCHRVLAAGGKLGGFSADGGVSTKRRMLAIEGAPGIEGPTLFDALEPLRGAKS
jgi:methylated-DNA-[protein]-cysteine S-methyltransferase